MFFMHTPSLPLLQCQRDVADLIQGKILVGHAVHNDLTVLLLSHPKHLLRDTQRYKGLCPDRPKSLKKLVAEVLHLQIQTGEHNSVEDARATLALYKHVRVKWEKEIFDKKRLAAAGHQQAASAAAAAAAQPAESTAEGGSTGAAAATPQTVTHKKKVDLAQMKLEQRKERNVERNQRRKKMRTEQKRERNNR